VCAETVLCAPWLYLAIALAVWIGAWSRRTEEATLARAVVSSGLLSVAPLFVIAPSPDFRYSVWLIAAALIGGLVLLSGVLRERSAAQAPRSARRRTERLEGKRNAGNRSPRQP